MNVIKKDAKSERGYDMRAQPRRRAKEENEQPLFLKKAFNMIDTCPDHLGGWSENGDTFIVKDIKKFSDQIIPTVFKHKNFSSFVRQLNFYGFRKIKSELYSHHTQWWEFRHPQFMKGQPELLSEIKRAVHYAAPHDQLSASHDMETLKTQVAGITNRVTDIDESISGLTQLVENLIAQRGHHSESGQTNIVKKRRIADIRPYEIHTDAAVQDSGAEDAYDDYSENYSMSSEEPAPAVACTNIPLGSELREVDHLNSDFFRLNSSDLLDDDLTIDFSDFTDHVPETESQGHARTKKAYDVPRPAALLIDSAPPPSSVSDIPDIMQQLSTEMQERFVDKLAESVGVNFAKLLASSISPQAPVSAIPAAPAMSMNTYAAGCFAQPNHFNAFGYANNRNGIINNDYEQINPSIALPLASAALCSLYTLHCGGSNSNSPTCMAVTAAAQAAGISCINGVCTSYSM